MLLYNNNNNGPYRRNSLKKLKFRFILLLQIFSNNWPQTALGREEWRTWGFPAVWHGSRQNNKYMEINVSIVGTYRVQYINNLRHSLVDGFNSISHGELVHDLLRVLVEVDFPRVITLGCRQHHRATIFFAQVVE